MLASSVGCPPTCLAANRLSSPRFASGSTGHPRTEAPLTVMAGRFYDVYRLVRLGKGSEPALLFSPLPIAFPQDTRSPRSKGSSALGGFP